MSSSKPITFDDSQWPLLVVRFQGACSNRQFKGYLKARFAYLLRGELHLPLLDMREAQLLSNHQRQMYIDWCQEHHALLPERMLGSAYLISSPAIQMALSLIRHFGLVSTPYLAATRPDEVARWAADRFQEAGLTSAAQSIRRRYDLPPSPAPQPAPLPEVPFLFTQSPLPGQVSARLLSR